MYEGAPFLFSGAAVSLHVCISTIFDRKVNIQIMPILAGIDKGWRLCTSLKRSLVCITS